jgi:cytochrome c biogenesis protein CcmG/thiol:disulfide interchange protein DsbE
VPVRLTAAVSVAALLALAGCTVDVADVDVVAVAAEADAPAPARDARLVDTTWPEAAAWVAREAADGRPTVLNVFASWCGPCRAEAPILRAAHAAHQDVAFLGVDHQDVRSKGEAFLTDERLEFPTLYDVEGEVARALGSTGMPTTAFFDHTGRLVAVHVGVLTEQLLAQRLADLEAAAAAARS